MRTEATARPEGDLSLRVIRRVETGSGIGRPLNLLEIVEHGFPQRGLADEVNDWRSDNSRAMLRGLRHQFRAHRFANRHGLPHFWSQLWLAKIDRFGNRLELGLASMRVVTTAGVNFLVDSLQGTVEPEILRYHGLGTGNTAEATGDTDLDTELTTQYQTDNTRATGSQTEGAAANVFRTVGTNTVDTAAAIVEHGIFSQAAVGGGTLLDRSVFAVVNLGVGDSLESTYDLTITAGG